MFSLNDIDNSWTLFLDRDGVINYEKSNDYIRNWEEFNFYDSSVEAISILRPYFSRIILVTNQKGIGKGLMSKEDLHDIHGNMLTEIRAEGGDIDQIFYCPDLDNESIDRKPNPGMAHQAKAVFPDIDFSKSIMVGNRSSDMEFGRNAGMHTVFLATTHPETAFPNPLIDLRFDNLLSFARAVAQLKKS